MIKILLSLTLTSEINKLKNVNLFIFIPILMLFF